MREERGDDWVFSPEQLEGKCCHQMRWERLWVKHVWGVDIGGSVNDNVKWAADTLV